MGEQGEWRTVNGHPVFITKAKGKTVAATPSKHSARTLTGAKGYAHVGTPEEARRLFERAYRKPLANGSVKITSVSQGTKYKGEKPSERSFIVFYEASPRFRP